MIYTSNFSKSSRAKGIRVSIVRVKTSWVRGSMYEEWWTELAPSETLLKMFKENYLSESEYEDRYLKEINANPLALAKIEFLKNTDKTHTLLCYCATGGFCHRNIIASILRDKGVEVNEL